MTTTDPRTVLVATHEIPLAAVRSTPLEAIALPVAQVLRELEAAGADPATLDVTIRAEHLAPQLPASMIVVRARAREARP